MEATGEWNWFPKPSKKPFLTFITYFLYTCHVLACVQPSLKSKPQLTYALSLKCEKMLCGQHFGREIAGMNKWEKPKVHFLFSGWRQWKVAHDKIQKCLLLECALGPLSHHMLRCRDGLFSLTVVGPCDSQIENVWKNAGTHGRKMWLPGKSTADRRMCANEKTPDL